jgi:putative membrane protein
MRNQAEGAGPRGAGLFLRGFAMGIAELVPGVSGGTIALITGIYQSLVTAVHQVLTRGLSLWARGAWRAGWREGHGSFLLVLGAGMAAGILALSQVVRWLLEGYPLHLSGFFLGLILAAAGAIGTLVRPWTLSGLLLAATGIVIGLGISAVPPALGGTASMGAVFVGGAIAICAWILPGVSGSYTLLLLGLYPVIIEAVASLNLVTLVTLGLGCLAGLFLFSGILTWLLARFYAAVLALLLGVMLGALPPLWPWLHPNDDLLGGASPAGPLFRMMSPMGFGQTTGEEPAVLGVTLATVFGIALVAALFGMDRSRFGRSP